MKQNLELHDPTNRVVKSTLGVVSRSIHSRIYAGQFASLMPFASQPARKLTSSRSTSFTSFVDLWILNIDLGVQRILREVQEEHQS
jgi:hypothetical protein